MANQSLDLRLRRDQFAAADLVAAGAADPVGRQGKPERGPAARIRHRHPQRRSRPAVFPGHRAGTGPGFRDRRDRAANHATRRATCPGDADRGAVGAICRPGSRGRPRRDGRAGPASTRQARRSRQACRREKPTTTEKPVATEKPPPLEKLPVVASTEPNRRARRPPIRKSRDGLRYAGHAADGLQIDDGAARSGGRKTDRTAEPAAEHGDGKPNSGTGASADDARPSRRKHRRPPFTTNRVRGRCRRRQFGRRPARAVARAAEIAIKRAAGGVAADHRDQGRHQRARHAASAGRRSAERRRRSRQDLRRAERKRAALRDRDLRRPAPFAEGRRTAAADAAPAQHARRRAAACARSALEEVEEAGAERSAPRYPRCSVAARSSQ